MSYCIRTEKIKIQKKRIIKFSKVIKVNDKNLIGQVSITNVRFYNGGYVEVDITFTGKVYVTFNTKKEWYGSDLMLKYNVSKIKINRYIKRAVSNDVGRRLNYFGTDLRLWDNIKKVKWI